MLDGMTVLIVMPLAEQCGGGEISLRQLVQYGRRDDVRWVVVFLEDGPMVDDFRGLGVNVVVVDAGRLREPHRLVAAVARIARVAVREQATIVLGWMEKGHVYGGPAALLAGRPAVWYQLGTPEPPDWLARAATAIPTRCVLTNSRAGAAAQRRIHPVRPQRTVYPGAELERFDPACLAEPDELRVHLGLPRDGPVVGIVCRLQKWKGVHVLIDAVALLRETHSLAHCVVVGGTHELEPDYAVALDDQVRRLGLGPHVTFAGLQANVPEWMQAMDVVVHASDREPFGIVVIEAMALGKPVIAGSGGGPSEIITDGVDGILVAYGDSAGLADAIRRYLDDPNLGLRAGLNARRRAADFSAARYADNLITALRELCSSTSWQPHPGS